MRALFWRGRDWLPLCFTLAVVGATFGVIGVGHAVDETRLDFYDAYDCDQANGTTCHADYESMPWIYTSHHYAFEGMQFILAVLAALFLVAGSVLFVVWLWPKRVDGEGR